MFDDLDRSLMTLLQRSISGLNSVTFCALDKLPPPSVGSGSGINLFLFEVKEHRDLRSPEPSLSRNVDGTVSVTRPPVKVDCLYLVTVWCASTQDAELSEHKLLSAAMRTLLRHPELLSEVLQGSLSAQDEPVRARVLPPIGLSSVTELWRSASGTPRASFFYVVTVSMDLEEPVQQLTLVTDLSLVQELK